jgi:hypothetical protein
MKASNQRGRGFLLIEVIAYIAMFMVVATVGFRLFYACWDNAKGVRRTTDQITQIIGAGERWRAEVRAATGALRVEEHDGETLAVIPRGGGEIDYRFAEGALWRRTGGAGDWNLLLGGVKDSKMTPDARALTKAWRWEVELATQKKYPDVRPRFTFEAVWQNKS